IANKKNAGQVYPARRKVTTKTTQLSAELATYELNHAQTHTQQGDRGASIRHTSYIRGNSEKLTQLTASALGRKSPVGGGRVKPVTAYESNTMDVKESSALKQDS